MLQPVVEDPYSGRSIASCASAISLRNSSGSDVCHIPPARGQFEFLAQNLELLDDISNCPLDPVIQSWRNQAFAVRREKALVHSGKKDPPGNWIAPPGNNRSGGGGNKAAGASGVEGR